MKTSLTLSLFVFSLMFGCIASSRAQATDAFGVALQQWHNETATPTQLKSHSITQLEAIRAEVESKWNGLSQETKTARMSEYAGFHANAFSVYMGLWKSFNLDKQLLTDIPYDDYRYFVNVILDAWGRLSVEQQRGDADVYRNRMWFAIAEFDAARGRYADALDDLNKEVQFQYWRNNKVFLGGQNPDFFSDLIKFEAKLLGHLGRGYYPGSVDHYIMPIDVNGDGVDEFVALENTSADKVDGVDIPSIPQDKERKILHLLVKGATAEYDDKDTAQMIGDIGAKSQVTLGLTESGAIIALSNITQDVVLRDGTPVSYTPRSDTTIRYKITIDGFTKQN